MSEHLLIEQMMDIVQKEIDTIVSIGKVEQGFIAVVVDCFRTHTALYHHGKAKLILFKVISAKNLLENDRKMLLELANEQSEALSEHLAILPLLSAKATNMCFMDLLSKYFSLES